MMTKMSARVKKVPQQHSVFVSLPPLPFSLSLPLKKNFKVALKSGDPLRTATHRQTCTHTHTGMHTPMSLMSMKTYCGNEFTMRTFF